MAERWEALGVDDLERRVLGIDQMTEYRDHLQRPGKRGGRGLQLGQLRPRRQGAHAHYSGGTI